MWSGCDYDGNVNRVIHNNKLWLRPTYQTQPAQRSALSRFHKHRHLGYMRVSHTCCAPVVESDLTEWHRCHGRHMPQHLRYMSYVHTSTSSSTLSGSAASVAKLSKNAKCADIIVGVDFVPLVIETSGVWGEHALILVKEVGRRIAEVSKEPRSTTFLRQRLMVAVQRGNATCILGALHLMVNDSSKQGQPSYTISLITIMLLLSLLLLYYIHLVGSKNIN